MHSSVSIVMATYNGGRFVARQIESIKSQVLPPAELIVSDDGSTDETLDVVEAASKGASFPVRVQVNTERKGFRRNFLEAASLATAPLVAFSDQDDVWHKNKLAVMAAIFDKPDVLLAYHNADLIDTAGRTTGRLYGANGAMGRSESTRIDLWSYSLGFTQVFRKDLLSYSDLQSIGRDHLFVDKEFAHDQWFYFLAACLGNIAFVDEPLVGYRQHESNVFGAVDRGRARRLAVVRATLDHSPVQLAARATSLRSRAQVLEAIAERESEPRDRVQAARTLAVHARAMADLYDRRLRMYGPFGFRKAAAWSRMIGERKALREVELSYPARHASRDLAFGVVLGHLAKPVGAV